VDCPTCRCGTAAHCYYVTVQASTRCQLVQMQLAVEMLNAVRPKLRKLQLVNLTLQAAQACYSAVCCTCSTALTPTNLTVRMLCVYTAHMTGVTTATTWCRGLQEPLVQRPLTTTAVTGLASLSAMSVSLQSMCSHCTAVVSTILTRTMVYCTAAAASAFLTAAMRPQLLALVRFESAVNIIV
jgi:hypothetical protein